MSAPLRRSVEWKQSMAQQADILQAVLSSITPEEKALKVARSRHDQQLASMGEIMPESHPVVSYVASLVSKLVYPAGVETLCVDTEQFLGYFHPNANRIVISRGLLRHLKLNIKEFSSDHIGAVLAHEKQHALAEEVTPVKNLDNGEAYLATHSPSEELRADAEGMEDMARAGFNPKAMREMLISFGLTGGRYDMAHPEILDRVHHLDNRFADDEHPVTRTAQPYQVIPAAVLKWCGELSSVYDETENLLASSAIALGHELQSADSLDRFNKVLKVKRHKEALAGLKYAAEDLKVAELWTDSVLGRAANNLVELFKEAKSSKDDHRVWIDSLVEKNIDKLLEHLKLTDIELPKPQEIDNIEARVDSHHIQVGLRALPFQSNESTIPLVADKQAVFDSGIALSTELYHNYLGQLLDKLSLAEDDPDLTALLIDGQPWGAYLKKLKEAFRIRAISDELLKAIYQGLDTAYVEDQRRKKDSTLAKSGRRASEKSKLTWDLNDPAVLAELKTAGKLSVANYYVSSPGEEQEIERKFQSLLVSELDCDPLTAEKLTAWRFGKMDMPGWQAYLKTLARDNLVRVIADVERFQNKNTTILKTSPLRELHVAFSISEGNNYGNGEIQPLSTNYQHHFRGGGVDNMGHGLDALSYQVAWEIYSRAYPADYFETFVSYKRPNELDITDDEWVTIGSFQHSPMFEEFRYHALQKFLKVGGDPKLMGQPAWQALVEHGGFPLSYDHEPQLVWAEIAAFIKISPWSAEETQEHLREFLSSSQVGGDLSSIKDKGSVSSFLKDMYRLSVDHPIATASPRNRTDISPLSIANKILDISVAIEREKDKTASLVTIIEDVVAQGVELSFKYLSKYLLQEIAQLSVNEKVRLHELAETISSVESPTLAQVMDIALLGPQITIDDFESMQESKVPVRFIDQCISSYGAQKLVALISTILPQAGLRDEYLVCIWETLPRVDDEKNLVWLLPYFSNQSPDNRGGRKSPLPNTISFRMHGASEYELATYTDESMVRQNKVWIEKKYGKEFALLDHTNQQELLTELKKMAWDEHIAPYEGTGIVKEQFADLLTRRMSFPTQAGWCHSQTYDYVSIEEDEKDNQYARPIQRFWATKVAREESSIWNLKDVNEQCAQLVRIVPAASGVRDVYVERIMHSWLDQRPDSTNVLKTGSQILALFSPNSIVASPLSHALLNAKWQKESPKTSGYNQALGQVLSYFPNHSLARNYYLDRLESECSLTAEELKSLTKLRITPEGQKDISENSPWVFIFRMGGELSRKERMHMYLWLSGLEKDKPLTVKNAEESLYGHADSFPKAFALLTPPERTILINRLALGVDGIFDRAAVLDKDLVAQEQKEFFVALARGALAGANQPKLEQLFVDLLSDLAPANGARLLSKLTDKIAEAKKNSQSLTPAKIAALVLAECGVVGKKSAQTLAEQDWVEENYRQELRTAQKDADPIPKRAMAEMADSYGLLSDTHGIQIISFDQLLGAASNKQAVILTVNITDRKFGLPLGINRVVGKFKRPSAQKEDNIHHDLHVLHTLVESMAKLGSPVPRGFEQGITQSVLQELRFGEEVVFANELRKYLPVTDGPYQIGIPKIIFSCEDIVLETLAAGISYREFQDQQKEGLLAEAYKTIDKKKIDRSIFKQALKQLAITGKIHADLHPGNIFIAPNTDITMIDLGMNLDLDEAQLRAVQKLLFALATGANKQMARALLDLGWSEPLPVKLQPGTFSKNINQFLTASQAAVQEMPPLMASLLNALAKLSPLAHSLSMRDVVESIMELTHSELSGQVRNNLRKLFN